MAVRLGVLLVMMTSCTRAPAQPELAQQFLDALNAHDADRVVALLTADATYDETGRTQPLTPAALRDHLVRQWNIWPDQVYTARRIRPLPDGAVVEWVAHQTYLNREAVSLQGVLLIDVHDGRIVAVRNTFDATPLLRFLKPKPS